MGTSFGSVGRSAGYPLAGRLGDPAALRPDWEAGSGSGSGTYTRVSGFKRVGINQSDLNAAIARNRAQPVAAAPLGNNCVSTPGDPRVFLRHLAAQAVFDEMAGSAHGKSLQQLRQGDRIPMTDAQLARVMKRAKGNGTIQKAGLSSLGERFLVFWNNSTDPTWTRGGPCHQVNGTSVGH